MWLGYPLSGTLDVLWGDYIFTADTTDGVRRFCLKPGQTFHLCIFPLDLDRELSPASQVSTLWFGKQA